MFPVIPQEADQLDVFQPVLVIYQDRSICIREIKDLFHLFFDAPDIVINLFLGLESALFCLEGRGTDHPCSAADQDNRPVTVLLESPHGQEWYKMSDMKAVCCRICT